METSDQGYARIELGEIGYHTATKTVYVVDEQGATFWFLDKGDAERCLVDEAWRGAVHLVIGKLEAPAELEGDALDTWCIHNAPDSGCDN